MSQPDAFNQAPSSAERDPRWARESLRLRRRYAKDKRFRFYTVLALLIAFAFLAVFLIDLVRRGAPALRQAEILTEIAYTPDTLEKPLNAFPEDTRDLVSDTVRWAVRSEVGWAEVTARVHFTEQVKEDPSNAIVDMKLTTDDLPFLFDGLTIPREHMLQLIDPSELGRLQQELISDPSLMGKNERVILRGSPALQQFLTDSTGLDEAVVEGAGRLDESDLAGMRFNAEKFGEGKSVEQWVLAHHDVDQYLKGYKYMKPESYPDPELAPITPEMAKRIDRLYDEGKIRLAFNHYFFTNGDSKTPETAGMWPAIVGSVMVLGIVLLLCLPIGVLTSIYLEEFAPDNIVTQTIEVNINNLAAIPSILFGVLGLVAFVTFGEWMGWGNLRTTAIVGGATLALMTLPVIIISTRAALRAVPDSIRRAGHAMGATRWQVVVHHVLPASISGIMTGSIIGLAQAMGETAPLIIVGLVAFVPEAPTGPVDPTTVMPAQIFSWWGMPQRAFQERAALAILVLLAVVFILNAIALVIRARSEKSW